MQQANITVVTTDAILFCRRLIRQSLFAWAPGRIYRSRRSIGGFLLYLKTYIAPSFRPATMLKVETMIGQILEPVFVGVA